MRRCRRSRVRLYALAGALIADMQDTTIDVYGVWVAKDVAEDAPELLYVRSHSSDGVLEGGPLLYHAHSLQPGLWRAPGTHSFLYFEGGLLWRRLRETNHRDAWQPFCRRGLDELLATPSAPDTRLSFDAMSERLRRDARVDAFELRDDEDGGRMRTLLRVWLQGYAEQRLWGEAGMFDLCDLE